MKETYLEDLIVNTKKDNKLKSDIILAVYVRACDDISSEVKAKDRNYDHEVSISDKILYNCIDPQLYKLMSKIDEATDTAVEINARATRTFNHGKGIELDFLEHLGSAEPIDNQIPWDLNNEELCKIFNTQIDEIYKLCKEIKHQ